MNRARSSGASVQRTAAGQANSAPRRRPYAAFSRSASLRARAASGAQKAATVINTPASTPPIHSVGSGLNSASKTTRLPARARPPRSQVDSSQRAASGKASRVKNLVLRKSCPRRINPTGQISAPAKPIRASSAVARAAPASQRPCALRRCGHQPSPASPSHRPKVMKSVRGQVSGKLC